MAYYFKVKIGFDKNDVIKIDETELAMAIRAQIGGKVAVFKGGTVAGNNIISILPDYNRELGLNSTYQLTDEDFRELGKKRVEEYRMLVEKETKAIGIGVSDTKRLN